MANHSPATMNQITLPMNDGEPASGRFTIVRPNGQRANPAIRNEAMPNGPAARHPYRVMGRRGAGWSARGALEPATLALAEPAPDAEPLIMGEGIGQAFGADLAAGADLLGLAGRTPLLGEERLRIGLSAQCSFVPFRFAGLHRREGNLPHGGHPQVGHVLLPHCPGCGAGDDRVVAGSRLTGA